MELLAPPLEPNLQVSNKYADELADTLLEVVHVNDAQSVETVSDVKMQLNEIGPNCKCLSPYVSFPSPRNMISQSLSSKDEENEESLENLPSHQLNEIGPNCKCLSPYVSFPSPRNMISQSLSSKDEENEESLENLPSHQVPTELKSAMKQGTSPRNKKVSWAPDVYDPPPTSMSHSIKIITRQPSLSKKDKRRGKRSHTHKSYKVLSKSSKERKMKPVSQNNVRSSSTMMFYELCDIGDDFEMMSGEKLENVGYGGSDNSYGSSFFKVFEQCTISGG